MSTVADMAAEKAETAGSVAQAVPLFQNIFLKKNPWKMAKNVTKTLE